MTLQKAVQEDPRRAHIPAAGHPKPGTMAKRNVTGMTSSRLEEPIGKLVALFGCGDQEDFTEYFCDALGTIRDIIEPLAAPRCGSLANRRLSFEASKGLQLTTIILSVWRLTKTVSLN